jgi:hypothetical protein
LSSSFTPDLERMQRRLSSFSSPTAISARPHQVRQGTA